MTGYLKRQRPQVRTAGAGENHRGIQATREFYSVSAAPQVVPVERVESKATRLPPYGKELVAALAAGRAVNVYLMSGSGVWDRARKRHADKRDVMLLPPGDDPGAYRWPAVPNGVFLHSIGELRERVFSIARAVVSCGTPMVFAVFGDGDALIVRAADWPNLRAAA